jgi:DNA-binding CsgD family transcriptional regulator
MTATDFMGWQPPMIIFFVPLCAECHTQKRLTESRIESQLHLTHREREVIGQLLSGARTREIAAKLCIGEVSVKRHLTHEKIGVSNRLELTLYVLERHCNGTIAKN